MAFWGADHTEKATINDPKRKFRFLVQIDGMVDADGSGTEAGTGVVWYAKTINKPGFSINAAEHNFLNHKFYYPGTVTWSDVTIAFVDPQNPDSSKLMSKLVEDGGYKVPANSNQLSTMSKASLGKKIGGVTIKQLNAAGNVIEEWKLWNPIITDVKYGDLAYGDDNLNELSMTFKYDWATLTPYTTSDDADTAAEGTKIFSPSNV